MTRQKIVDAALNAYTLDECQAAEVGLLALLDTHPGDAGLHEVAGLLGIVKSAAQERALTTLLHQEKPARINLAELTSRMPLDYQTQEDGFGQPVGKEEW